MIRAHPQEKRIKSELFSIYFNVLKSHNWNKNENKENVKWFARRENGMNGKMYDFASLTCIYKCWNISEPSFSQVICGRGLPCATHKNAILCPSTYSKSKCDACKIFAPCQKIFNAQLVHFWSSQKLVAIFMKKHVNYVIVVVVLIRFGISVFACNRQTNLHLRKINMFQMSWKSTFYTDRNFMKTATLLLIWNGYDFYHAVQSHPPNIKATKLWQTTTN